CPTSFRSSPPRFSSRPWPPSELMSRSLFSASRVRPPLLRQGSGTGATCCARDSPTTRSAAGGGGGGRRPAFASPSSAPASRFSTSGSTSSSTRGFEQQDSRARRQEGRHLRPPQARNDAGGALQVCASPPG